MADIMTPAQRSHCMAQVRSKGMRPEMVIRSLVHKMGYRFRLHRHDLPGKPDIVLPKHQAVIFVNGCFWHWHPDTKCPIAKLPKSNLSYWRPKLTRTRERDRVQVEALEELGWRVLTIWECSLRDLPTVEKNIHKFLSTHK